MANIKCDRCGHSWNYTGNAPKPTCPACTYKLKTCPFVDLDNIIKRK